MTTMLRYVRHLRKLNHVGWKVALHQPHLEITGIKQLVNQLPNLSRSYATRLATKQLPVQNEKHFQNIENQLRRTGRVLKGDIEQWLQEIIFQRALSSLDALLLIRSCGKTLIDATSMASIQLVQKIWQTLEELKVKMDVSHYNALLNVYLEKDFEFSPEQFLSMMAEKKIEPNRITFQRLIARYCNKGDIASATKILEEMKNRGMPLCEDVFSSLIRGHSEAGDMESAVNTLSVMKNAGIHASADIYTTLLCAYAKRGDMDSIKRTFDQMEKEEVSLLDAHYLDIIYTLAANGHVSQAEELVKKLPGEVHADTDIGRILVKLTFDGQLEFALKLLKSTAMDPTRHRVRSTFIFKAVMQNGGKIEDILRVCEFIQKEFHSDKGYSLAVYNCLIASVDPNTTIKIMQEWAKTGAEIREHFFWPLLISQGKVNNSEGMIEILKSMKENFNISPSFVTLRDYVIRYIPGNSDVIINSIEPLNIPRNDILVVIVDRFLIEKKLRNAATIMISNPAIYPKDILLRHMVDALMVLENFKSFVVVLRNLSVNSEPANPDQVPTELVDEALGKVMALVPSNRSSIIENLLSELEVSGLSISTEVGNQLKNYLGSNATQEVNATIDKLTSGNLTVVPLAQYNPTTDRPVNFLFNRNIPNLKQIFFSGLEQKDADTVLDSIKKMDELGQNSVQIMAQAISCFCETNNLEIAQEYMAKFKTDFPDAKLDNKKILKYAELLIKNDKFDDAVKYLTEQPLAESNEAPNHELTARSLLETTANTKNVEHTNQIFELLRKKNYIEIDNFSLGPLVKVHTLRNDLSKALETFERACIDHKCTPYKNKLAMLFIEAEDANNLQKLTDLCTELHGESNALVDLAFAFIECGKIRQARKIFETPGLQVSNNKITRAIEHFDKFNPEGLERLVDVTRDITRMNRGFMFNVLLDVYINNNNWQQGLALWTEMQEYDVQPTNEFLSNLRSLLEKNNQNVPFVNDTRYDSITLTGKPRPVRVGAFEDAVKAKNYTEAEKLISISTHKASAVGKYTRLINTALLDNQVDVAFNMAKSMLTKYSFIPIYCFTELATKLNDLNRFEAVEQLGNLMSEHTKWIVGYEKMISIGHIKSKGLKNYIDTFDIDKKVLQSKGNIRSIEKYMHFGAMVHSLLEDDSCLNDFEIWAEKLYKIGIHRGKHVLWNYYFIKGDPKAEMLWKNVIVDNPSPLTRPIIEYASKNKNIELIEKLKTKLDEHPNLSVNVQGRIVSDLIDYYNSLGRFEDALKILNEVRERYSTNIVRSEVILDLKRGLESIGKSFPYTIQNQDSKRKEREPQFEENLRSGKVFN